MEHKKTAPIILAEVKRLMFEHSSTSVVLVHLYRPIIHYPEGVLIPFCVIYISRLATHSAGRLRNLTRSS
jgi:hypothetical protein